MTLSMNSAVQVVSSKKSSTTSSSSSRSSSSSFSFSSSVSYFPINKDAPILSQEVAKKCVLLGNKRLKRSGVHKLNNDDIVEEAGEDEDDLEQQRSSSSSSSSVIGGSSSKTINIKTLTHSDLILGNCIGQGSFSNVYNVKALVVRKDHNNDTQEEEEEELEEEDESTSTLASSSSSSLSFSSFDANQIVIKVLRKKLINTPKMFAACIGDIYKESLILRSLNHTNIVKIHAVGGCNTNNGTNGTTNNGMDCYKNGRHDAFFIVLDKLNETLSDRLKVWKTIQSEQQQKKKKNPSKRVVSSLGKKLFKLLLKSKNKKENPQKKLLLRNDTVRIDDHNEDEQQQHQHQQLLLHVEQSMAVIQLAEAINYLHSKRMIHRDIKPDNIGFDSNGQLKLFDFDVARMLPTTKTSSKHRRGNDPPTAIDDDNDDDTIEEEKKEIVYKMTKRIGSPRYMSPECGCGYKYNSKTDVYSYGLVVYEIFSLTKPYDDLPSELHEKLVFMEGIRPKIPIEWTSSSSSSSSSIGGFGCLQNLLERCWSSNIHIRPTMEEILYEIKVQQQQQEVNDDDDDSSSSNDNGESLLLPRSDVDNDNDDDRRLIMKKSLSSSGRTTATTILTTLD